MTQTDIIGVIVLLTIAFTAIGLLVYLLTRSNRGQKCKYCGKQFENTKNGLLQCSMHEILHDETLEDLEKN